jgi:hypothetical protein
MCTHLLGLELFRNSSEIALEANANRFVFRRCCRLSERKLPFANFLISFLGGYSMLVCPGKSIVFLKPISKIY